MDSLRCPLVPAHLYSCWCWLVHSTIIRGLQVHRSSSDIAPGNYEIRKGQHQDILIHKKVWHSEIQIFPFGQDNCCWMRKTEKHSGRLLSDRFLNKHLPAGTWHFAPANPPCLPAV